MERCYEPYAYNKFKIKLLNDIQNIYADACIEKEDLVIKLAYYEVTISLKDGYDLYSVIQDYNSYLRNLLENINEYLNEHKFKIEPKQIFPLVRSKNFGLNEGFARDNLFLDLDILYVQDMGEMYRYIYSKEMDKFKNIKEYAFNNLSKITNGLIEIDMNIYMYKFANDFNASMLLLGDEFDKIVEKVGDRFLMSVPNSMMLTIATDNPINYDILSKLINEQENEDKTNMITDRIYRYNNGVWSYANAQLLSVVE